MNNNANRRGHPHLSRWDPKYREGVLSLFYDVPHKRELWDWQFESNPYGLQFDPVVLVDDSDRVVGFNGVMPVSASEDGVPISVVWSCDFFLKSEWRGHGLASLIKSELHEKTTATMAFGISERASVVLRHLGWLPDQTIRSYRMIRRFQGWRSWVFRCLQFGNRLIYGRLLSRKDQPIKTSLEVHSSLPEQESVDELWERCVGGYERVVNRHYCYLDWRYQRHPLGRYAFIHARTAGGLKAILIVRTSSQSLKIVDYVGPRNDFNLKKDLVHFAVHHWRHVTHISAVTSDAELGECLASVGFIQTRGKPRFYRYEQPGSDKHWFIMAGDSDGEFLQAAHDFSIGGESP